MSGDHETPTSREQRLNEAIARFLQAAQSGSSVDRAEFLRQHADLAPELESFLADHDKLNELATLELGETPAGHRDPTADEPPLAKIRYFGDYELLQEIARGGMGVVYKARQVSLNRTVAVKMILRGHLKNEDDVQRFRAEAEAAGNLQHPNIVSIHEVGQYDGQHYFSMDYVEGESLAALVRRGALPGKRVASLLKTVAEAIHYAHQRGILHRDLKPANVLVDGEGQPHVTDFGLAKQIADDPKGGQSSHDMTHSGTIIGTPGYMSPEQASGDSKTIATTSDVYSLGAILYEMLTGRPPFRASTPLDTLLQVRERDPDRPRSVNARVDLDLETICLKCLDKNPDRRYVSAAALADDLGRWLDGLPVVARRSTLPERAFKWARRRPAIAALTVLLVVVTCLGVAGVTWKWREALDAAEQASASEAEAKARAAAEAQAKVAAQLAKQKEANARAEEKKARRRAEKALENVERERDAKTAALSRAEGLRLAAEASAARFSDPGLALLLAIEGVQRAPHQHTFSALWDAIYACKEERTLIHKQQVESVQYAAKTDRVVSVTKDGLHVWPLDGGDPVVIENNGPRVVGARFSPDGRRIVTTHIGYSLVRHNNNRMYTYTDRVAHIWDAGNGKEVVRLRRHNSRIVSAEFDATGRRVVTASWDGTARIWDANTGKEIHHLDAAGAALLLAHFSPDGERVLTVTSNKRYHVNYLQQRDDSALVDPPLARDTVYGKTRGHAYFSVKFGGTPHIAVIWDADTGEKVATLKKWTLAPLLEGWHPTVATFSPDGKYVAVGFEENAVGIWEISKPDKEHFLLPLVGAAKAVAFSPDSGTLVCADESNELRLWCRTTRKVRSYRGHTDSIESVVFSDDGARVLTASRDRTARLWDIRSGRVISTLRGHTAGLNTAVLVPSSPRVITAGDETVRIWNLARAVPGQVLRGHTGSVVAIQFSPEGDEVLTGSADGTIRIWNAQTGEEARDFGAELHLGEVRSAHFGAQGERVVTASANTRVMKAGKVINTSSVHLWEAGSGRELLALTEHGSGANWAALSLDGTRLVTVSDGATSTHSVDRGDAAGGNDAGSGAKELLSNLLNLVRPGSVRLDVEKKSTAKAGVVRVWNAKDGELLATLPAEVRDGTVPRFSPDGLRVIMAPDRTNEARIYDAATGKELLALPGHRRRLTWVGFSPDGRRAVTASGDRTVRIWNGTNGHLLNHLTGFAGAVTQAGFSSDGRRLFTLCQRTVFVWDAISGKRLAACKARDETVTAVSFSDDGRRLAMASDDASASVWDIDTGRLLALFKGHTESITSVAFSRDGETVGTASEDGTARLWPLDLLNHARRLLPRDFTKTERERYEIPELVSAKKLVGGGSERGPRAQLEGERASNSVAEATPEALHEAARTAATELARLSERPGENRTQQLETGAKLRAFQRRYPGTPAALKAASFLKTIASPLDHLSNEQMAQSERFEWQPKELVAVLGQHRQRLWGRVSRMMISPNGRFLAVSGGQKDRVLVLEMGSREELASVFGELVGFVRDTGEMVVHQGRAVLFFDMSQGRPRQRVGFKLRDSYHAFAISPDGKYVVVSGDHHPKYSLRLWDVSGESPRAGASLVGHEKHVVYATFSPDGRRIATGSRDRSVRLWQLRGDDVEEVAVFKEQVPESEVPHVAFSPDGKLLAAVNHKSGVRIWDVSDENSVERSLLTAELGKSWLLRGLFSPDGKTFAAGCSNGSVYFWNVADAKLVKRISATRWEAKSLVFSCDGKRFCTAGSGPGIRFWDMTGEAPEEIGSLRGHTKTVESVSFSSDGKWLASAAPDDTVRLWDLTLPVPVERHELKRVGWCVVFSPDAQRFMTGGSRVRIWDISEASAPVKVGELTRHRNRQLAFSFSGDGRLFAVGRHAPAVRLWDMSGVEPKVAAEIGKEKSSDLWVESLSLSANGKVLAGAGSRLKLWDLSKAGAEERPIPSIEAKCMAVSPDGKILAYAGDSPSIHLMNLTSPIPVVYASLKGHGLKGWSGIIEGIAFSPDATQIASAGQDGRVIIWDVATRRKVHEWQFPGPIGSLAFAADGRHIATGNANGTVYVLRIREMAERD